MNNRYDGTNGNGYQPLPLHGNDNPKAPPRRARPAEAEGVDRQRMIESMCLTRRHDFGLDMLADCRLSSGMTDTERNKLRDQMGKLFDHHFAPALSAVTAERDRLRKANASRSDKLNEAQSIIDQLRAEVDQLRNELAGKPLVC